jgi:hypothetical protein
MSIAPALNSSSPRPLRHAAEKQSLVPVSLVPVSLAPLLLTPVVLLVHGYHPFAGDAGIYVAGVRHILDPSLYPLNAAFPAAFTRLSILPWTLAALVRVTHLPLSWILFTAHLLSIFLFLTACRQLATRLFATESAAWFSQLLAAACFTMPVAGTALFVMDPYVTARSFSTPVSLMALAACIDRAWPRTILLLIIAALIHPLMAAYAIAFVALYSLVASGRIRLALIICGAFLTIAGVAFGLAHGTPASPAYRQAVSLPARTFLFLARWHWYEILGLILPLVLFTLALRKLGSTSRKGALCRTCLLIGFTSTLIAALFVPPAGPYPLVPLQVLRSFHVIYLAGVLISGGIVADFTARWRPAAVAIFALLFAGMFVTQRLAWSGSNHLEWPGIRTANPYQQAFLWIRDNTPRNAVFAFNPQLVYLPQEDEQGFRAIAQRDHLADDKDAGIVAVQPQLADRWALQRNAEFNVDQMTDAQRAALESLGANWLLLPPEATTELPCPWSNVVVKVCRITRQEADR